MKIKVFIRRCVLWGARKFIILAGKENLRWNFHRGVYFGWPRRTIRYRTTVPLIRKSSACGKLLTLPHTKAVSTGSDAGWVTSVNRLPHRKSRRRPHRNPFKNTNCTPGELQSAQNASEPDTFVFHAHYRKFSLTMYCVYWHNNAQVAVPANWINAIAAAVLSDMPNKFRPDNSDQRVECTNISDTLRQPKKN